jgi:hypothetical protein
MTMDTTIVEKSKELSVPKNTSLEAQEGQFAKGSFFSYLGRGNESCCMLKTPLAILFPSFSSSSLENSRAHLLV